MQTLDYRIGYFLTNTTLSTVRETLLSFENNALAVNLSNNSLHHHSHIFDIILVESSLLPQLKNENKFKARETVILAVHKDAIISIDDFNSVAPASLIDLQFINYSWFIQKLQAFDQESQNKALFKVAEEQQITNLSRKRDLKQKIEAIKEELTHHKQLILESKNRNDSLIKILFSISAENEISRIETILNELLPKSTSATWIKIVPQEIAEVLEADLKKEAFNFYIKKSFSTYNIYFVINNVEFFKKSEYEIFQNITDVLDTLFSKISSSQQQQQLERIISTAFNSIFYPVIIVDKNYEIIESNKAFIKHASPNNKCYEAMFGRKAPCEKCQIGKSFQIEVRTNNETAFFNVQSQKLKLSDDLNSQWFHFYTDVTEEKILENRLTQNVKMKELGLISSSIAHELNNPLGGIISYIQILQMELDKQHPLQSDLIEMATAATRMKIIIENLLIFSRRPLLNEKQIKSINAIVLESLKLNELQFKVENIKTVIHLDEFEIQKIISETAFRDSINLVINFFTSSFKKTRPIKSPLPGLIEVKISQDQMNFYLNFESNCGPLSNDQKNKNIYFLIIHKSLNDQGFQVELTEPNLNWLGIKVIIPKA